MAVLGIWEVGGGQETQATASRSHARCAWASLTGGRPGAYVVHGPHTTRERDRGAYPQSCMEQSPNLLLVPAKLYRGAHKVLAVGPCSH